jgi:hypothetical protein
VSVATANLLSAAGKEHWVTRREEMVVAKGIGAVVTYGLSQRQNGEPRCLLAKARQTLRLKAQDAVLTLGKAHAVLTRGKARLTLRLKALSKHLYQR